MAPREHIDWFDDNVAWLAGLDEAWLGRSVPACPGWDVEHVLNHLTFGLGLAYPIAMDSPPATPDDEVFAMVPWPTSRPHGPAALEAFAVTMGACVDRFRAADPEQPCWTYAGPGSAAFWFRRAAVETTLHRMDVAEALNDLDDELDPPVEDPLDHRRGRDAIEETLSFALPLAAQLTTAPSGAMRVASSCLPEPIVIGAGEPAVGLHGEPGEVLKTLWGRSADTSIIGDRMVASEWLGLISAAFDGR